MKPKAIIETQGLVMRFGGVEVLGGIDFAIAYGELRCLIGPNGAGKSTFFKCITGQLKPTAGSIKFKNGFGHCRRRRVNRAARHGYQDAGAVAL